MSESKEDLRRKIAGLLAKAHGTDNEYESAAFAAKARQLMEDHQFTMSQVLGSKDPLGETIIEMPGKHDAYISLAHSAATYFGGCIVFHKMYKRSSQTYRLTTKHSGFLYGRDSARTMIEAMLPYLWQECFRVGRRLHYKKKVGDGPSDAAFQVMFALAVRLNKLAGTSPAKPGAPGLPVPVSESEAMAKAMHQTTEKSIESAASEAACKAAEEISLAGQLAKSSSETLRIG
jgi:hypothetical protein